MALMHPALASAATLLQPRMEWEPPQMLERGVEWEEVQMLVRMGGKLDSVQSMNEMSVDKGA